MFIVVKYLIVFFASQTHEKVQNNTHISHNKVKRIEDPRKNLLYFPFQGEHIGDNSYGLDLSLLALCANNQVIGDLSLTTRFNYTQAIRVKVMKLGPYVTYYL